MSSFAPMPEDVHDRLMKTGFDALRAGDLVTAGQIAESAIARNPNDLRALGLLGAIHHDLQNYGTAMSIARLRLQIAHASNCVDAEHWYSVSTACRKTYQQAQALDALDKAHAMRPDDADIHSAYASYWLTYGDPAKAEAASRRCLELAPEDVQGHVNLGMALLSLDRWQEAWPHIEYRKKLKRWTRKDPPMHEWHGEPCDTLLIHGEQGLGDEIFNCSMINRIQNVNRVVVECSERLVPLLRRSLGCEVYGSMEECARNGVFSQDVMDEINGVVPQPVTVIEPVRPNERYTADPAIHIDVPNAWDSRPRFVAMGSLPGILGATRENSADNAYLQADPLRALYWRAGLTALAEGRPIVGVAWRGGTYENHEVLRNPPIDLFKRLNPDRYCLVSVQYTPEAAQQAKLMGARHFQQAIDDIDEQAALIRALDCLVTVAQTAMHIGGSLGVPTLALIGQYPKWDCGQSGDTVPWWKSVKAIRQQGDDWSGAFDRLLAEMGEEPITDQLSFINIGDSDAQTPDFRDARSAAE